MSGLPWYRVLVNEFEWHRDPQSQYWFVNVNAKDARDALTIARLNLRMRFGAPKDSHGVRRWEIVGIYQSGATPMMDDAWASKRTEMYR